MKHKTTIQPGSKQGMIQLSKDVNFESFEKFLILLEENSMETIEPQSKQIILKFPLMKAMEEFLTHKTHSYPELIRQIGNNYIFLTAWS